MLFAGRAEQKKLGQAHDGDTVIEIIFMARSFVGFALFIEAKRVFNEEDRVDIIENDGMRRFEDDERVEWVMDSPQKGMNNVNIVKLYQI